MSQYIQEVANEAAEILANITAAVRNGEITWQQGVELKQIVLNDTADAAGLQLARELLYFWSGVDYTNDVTSSEGVLFS